MKKATAPHGQPLTQVYNPVEAALALIGNGWAVFPCQWQGPSAKAPLIGGGFKSATTDPEQVRRWWGRWPHALIGAPVPLGVVVLDLDPRKNSHLLEELELKAGPLPVTLTTLSGRGDGGVHLYYRRPVGELTGARLPEGVDLRVGGNHYMIMPPSPHPVTGRPYTWLNTMTPQPLPQQAVKALLRPAPPVPTNTEGRTGAGLVGWYAATAQEGERNTLLYWALCRCAETGDRLTASQLCDEAVRKGLSPQEVERTFASAFNGGGVK